MSASARPTRNHGRTVFGLLCHRGGNMARLRTYEIVAASRPARPEVAIGRAASYTNTPTRALRPASTIGASGIPRRRNIPPPGEIGSAEAHLGRCELSSGGDGATPAGIRHGCKYGFHARGLFPGDQVPGEQATAVPRDGRDWARQPHLASFCVGCVNRRAVCRTACRGFGRAPAPRCRQWP